MDFNAILEQIKEAFAKIAKFFQDLVEKITGLFNKKPAEGEEKKAE